VRVAARAIASRASRGVARARVCGRDGSVRAPIGRSGHRVARAANELPTVLREVDDAARALDAARAAIAVAMRARGRNAVAERKRDSTIATVADVAAQVACARALRGGEGEDFVGEETTRALDGDADVVTAILTACGAGVDETEARERLRETSGGIGRYWVCDPLDGTKAFAASDDDDADKQYVLGLALMSDVGTPEIAVMIAPKWPGGGLEVVAARGRGCFARSRDDETSAFRRVSCAQPKALSDANVVISAHESFESLPLGRAGVSPARVRRLCCGSLCKYVDVVAGSSSIFIQHAKEGGDDACVNSWDHAAGVLCAEEAGCVVTDLHGRSLGFLGRDGDRRRFSPGGGGVICAAKSVHENVVRAFREGIAMSS
jgi:3'-phosphoadenosine 5'-phosphosulfate (PAPS) 3'-phosphatase